MINGWSASSDSIETAPKLLDNNLIWLTRCLQISQLSTRIKLNDFWCLYSLVCTFWSTQTSSRLIIDARLNKAQQVNARFVTRFRRLRLLSAVLFLISLYNRIVVICNFSLILSFFEADGSQTNSFSRGRCEWLTSANVNYCLPISRWIWWNKEVICCGTEFFCTRNDWGLLNKGA